MKELLEQYYSTMDGSECAEEYHKRHGVKSAGILTIYDDESAAAVAANVATRIEGKTVVEVGGGIGMLAMHLADYAKRVFVIEADPTWASIHVMFFYKHKPKNVTFIFGAADELAGHIRGDVALFCTHSAARDMREQCKLFAPEVIDVYGEVLAEMNRGFVNEIREQDYGDPKRVDAIY